MNRNLMIIRILALIAFGLSSYILWTTVSESSALAGCGEGSGCDAVLQTKWSKWFGIPVSAGALVVYGTIVLLTFLISSGRIAVWSYLVFFSLLAAASGVWFMLLQAFLIKNYCIYCSIVHLCGIVITVFILKSVPVQSEEKGKKKKVEPDGIPAKKFFYAGLFGLLSVTILAYGQMKSRPANLAEIQEPSFPEPSPVPARTVPLLNGTVSVSAGKFPVLGAMEADRVVAHLFDYTCPACRKLHSDLLQAVQANQQKASLVMIPMPLDADCNPRVGSTSYQHLNACNFARLGLAIWRTKPEAYASFDHFMFQEDFPPSLEQARAVADKLAGHDAVENAFRDPRIENLLRTGINIFHSSALQRKVLPILITPEKAVYGIPDPPELTAMFTHH